MANSITIRKLREIVNNPNLDPKCQVWVFDKAKDGFSDASFRILETQDCDDLLLFIDSSEGQSNQ